MRYGTQPITYAQLVQQAQAAAMRLRHDFALPAGAASALLLHNGNGFIQAWFASLFAGLVDVPINHEFRKTALLFGLENADARAIFCDTENLHALLDGVELGRYTDRTITSRRLLAQALADIRAKGFGEDAEEYTVGVRCVAVPVFDQRGATVAAISVSVPIIRFDEAHRKRALKLLREGAERLSASLGFRLPTNA